MEPKPPPEIAIPPIPPDHPSNSPPEATLEKPPPEPPPRSARDIVVPGVSASPAVNLAAPIASTDPPPSGRVTVMRGNNLDPYQFPDPPRGGSNSPPGTIENVAHILDQYGISVRFNVIKKRMDILIPGAASTVHNRANVTLTHIYSLAAKHGMQTGHIADYVLALADRNPYNPVADWIASQPWDGQQRIDEICATVVEEAGYPEGFKTILISKWLLSLVAAAMLPHGFKSRGVLTLQGPQGIGKTTWFKQLVSDTSLRDEVVKLGHRFEAGNKDTKLEAVRHWLVELGELEGSFRKDIAGLKSFITEDYDKIRPPFMRVEVEYPRQTGFGASVNEREFLQDSTGNSRFWTIPVASLDYQHDIDMQQVFAELKELDQGAQWWLTGEEEAVLASRNEQHRTIGAVTEKVIAVLDLPKRGRENNPRMSASEVLALVGVSRPTNPQSKECAAVLRLYLGDSTRSHGINRWQVPVADHVEVPTMRRVEGETPRKPTLGVASEDVF